MKIRQQMMRNYDNLTCCNMQGRDAKCSNANFDWVYAEWHTNSTTLTLRQRQSKITAESLEQPRKKEIIMLQRAAKSSSIWCTRQTNIDQVHIRLWHTGTAHNGRSTRRDKTSHLIYGHYPTMQH